MKYLAHSEKQENGRHYKSQTYDAHSFGVYSNCLRNLETIKPHVNPVLFETIKRIVLLAAVYHDLGKLDSQAQKVLKGKCKDKMINHVDAGTGFLLKLFEKNKQMEYLIAAYVVNAHHIGFIDWDKIINRTVKGLTAEYSAKDKLRDSRSCTIFGLEDIAVRQRTNKNLSRMVKVHEKEMGKHGTLDMGQEKVDQSSAKRILNDYALMKTCISILCDADHEDTSLHYEQDYPSRMYPLDAKKRIVELDKYMGHFKNDTKRNQMRKEFYENCISNIEGRNFELITGTVGMGKTLGMAARQLRTADTFGQDKLIYVMPFISLIEQSGGVYKESMSLGKDDAFYNISEIHSILKVKSVFHRKYAKGFNAPINLTTSVNFFNILTSNHTSVFKHFYKFIGSCIGIDEYHTIAGDEYWPFILCILKSLTDNFNCKVLFSSGTPPNYWEIDNVLDSINKDFHIDVHNVISDFFYKRMVKAEEKRVKVINALKFELNFAMVKEMIDGLDGSIFCVFNTRKRGMKFFKYLKEHNTNPNRKIYLRYSALAPRDRKRQMEIIKEKLAKKEQVILIATIGSDVGMDLSFHHGLKESAGFNSLLQIKGRINRHGEYTDSKLIVFKMSKDAAEDGDDLPVNPSLEKEARIYEEELKAHKSLKTLSPKYCTHMKNREYEEMSRGKIEAMREHVRNWNNKAFEKMDEFNLIPMPMIHVLIDRDIYNKILKNEYVKWHEVQDCIVNMTAKDEEIQERIEKNLLISLDKRDDEEYDAENADKKDNKYDGMYFWNGTYDPDNLGLLAGWYSDEAVTNIV